MTINYETMNSFYVNVVTDKYDDIIHITNPEIIEYIIDMDINDYYYSKSIDPSEDIYIDTDECNKRLLNCIEDIVTAWNAQMNDSITINDIKKVYISE